MFWKFFQKGKRKAQLPNSDFQPDESRKPGKIRLITDDYHLEGLGKRLDGTYFLVSSQLKYDHHANATTDYICKFCFNSDGDLIEQKIVKLGIRGEFEHEDGVKMFAKLTPAEGTYEDADIRIKPFSVSFEGVEFGFITRTPEDEEDVWAVEFMPGNTMAFFEPWESGEYDT